jgi:hypothetical protein
MSLVAARTTQEGWEEVTATVNAHLYRGARYLSVINAPCMA